MRPSAGAAAAGTTAGRAPVVALVAVEGPTGAELAAGLGDRGAAVTTVADAVLAHRADFGDALDAVARRHGALDAVVVASVDSGPTRRGDVAGLDAEAWRRRVEIPLHRTLVCFQGTFDALRSTGGTMVLLVPTLSLVGAAGFGPWAAVTEGQRALAKAAARAWGRAVSPSIAWPCPAPCSRRRDSSSPRRPTAATNRPRSIGRGSPRRR